MQHETSIVYRKAINQGAQPVRVWTNGETGDQNVSLVEFGNADGVYLFDNCSANLIIADFDGAIRIASGEADGEVVPVAELIGLCS